MFLVKTLDNVVIIERERVVKCSTKSTKKNVHLEYQTMDTPSLRISYKSTLSPFTAAGVYAYNNGGGYAHTQKSATSGLSREAM